MAFRIDLASDWCVHSHTIVDFAVWIKFCVDLGETNCFRFCILGFLQLQLQLHQIIAVYINHNT